MKKIILIIICIVFLPLTVMAENSALNSIENAIFGIDYKKETDIQRVERIERYLYGSKKSGNIHERIKTIQDDIGYSEPVVQKTKPPQTQAQTKTQMPVDLKNNSATAISNEVLNMKEDSTVEYPIVDKMEQEVFKTTYKSENIYKRLDRLEEKVFKKKSSASLNERVNKLSEVIKPVKTARMPEQTSYNDPYADFFQDQQIGRVDSQSMTFHLAALEQELLKANYSNDNNANRLSRLEKALFNKTYPSDSDAARMQRLLVAYNAKRSSYKYDSNHTMQNMATMSQIGGILLMILAMLL